MAKMPTNPTTVADYEALIDALGLTNASRGSPVFTTDGHDVFAIVGVDIDDDPEAPHATARVVDANHLEAQAREVSLDDLAHDYRSDRFKRVSQHFVGDHEVVVPRLTLATLADAAHDAHIAGANDDDVWEAVTDAYALLDYDPE